MPPSNNDGSDTATPSSGPGAFIHLQRSAAALRRSEVPTPACVVTGVELRGASCTTISGGLLVVLGVGLLLAAHALRRRPSRRPTVAKEKPTPERSEDIDDFSEDDTSATATLLKPARHSPNASLPMSESSESVAVLRHRGSPGASLRSTDGNGSGDAPAAPTPAEAAPQRPRPAVTIAGADSFWTVTSDGVSTLHKYRRDP